MGFFKEYREVQQLLQATAPLFIQDTISEWKEPEDTLIIADDFFSV